jgi:hypothetical protein
MTAWGERWRVGGRRQRAAAAVAYFVELEPDAAVAGEGAEHVDANTVGVAPVAGGLILTLVDVPAHGAIAAVGRVTWHTAAGERALIVIAVGVWAAVVGAPDALIDVRAPGV